jgi:uncharacterized repeat protein (TIGR03803 family)
MSKLSLLRTVLLACVFCAAAVIGSPAQTFKTLFTFNGTDGLTPIGSLVQGLDGNFYGATASGGAYGGGTFFKITPGGVLTTLYNFCSRAYCTGSTAGLVLATNGSFYGTGGGGTIGYGTVFKITPSGTLTVLYNFCNQSGCRDGTSPNAGLVQATNGDLYGTTFSGGAYGYGTVFKIGLSGGFYSLYSFCSKSGCTDGGNPDAGLVQATNGNLYGTTSSGGAYGYGTVFEITPGGKLTVLDSFDGMDGESPHVALAQATNGDLYGTTPGGAYGFGNVFKMGLSGGLLSLYSFCAKNGCPDGEDPSALAQATNGDLYGTTFLGGAYGSGTVFKMGLSGGLHSLYSFCAKPLLGCPDGFGPSGAPVQSTNGNFYGVTQGNDDDECDPSCGTVFSLSVGLGPFVETIPTSGAVGTKVTILGNKLKGTTRVTFNGKSVKSFTVNSTGTAITTTVPSGATTGYVKMITASRTMLTSSVKFRIP